MRNLLLLLYKNIDLVIQSMPVMDLQKPVKILRRYPQNDSLTKNHMDNAVYIVTNPSRKVLYTGVTNNLPKRISEHYSSRGQKESFAGRYYCYCLVWYDVFPTMYEAIQAEKRIKGKSRAWKEELIAKSNKEWKFLNKDIIGEWPPRKTCPVRSGKVKSRKSSRAYLRWIFKSL